MWHWKKKILETVYASFYQTNQQLCVGQKVGSEASCREFTSHPGAPDPRKTLTGTTSSSPSCSGKGKSLMYLYKILKSDLQRYFQI